MQVYSMSLPLLVWALIDSGADTHMRYKMCNGKHAYNFPENPQDCQDKSAIFIEDSRKNNRDTVGKDSFSEKIFEAAMRRDCSRHNTCKMTSSWKYLEKYKCDDASLPTSNITLVHRCKPFGQDLYKDGVGMCRDFKETSENKPPTVLALLKSPSNNRTRCTLKSHDNESPISLRTLQVDFGPECDTSSDCQSHIEITLDQHFSKKYTLKSFNESSTTFSGSNIEINIEMQTGLVWLEVTARSKYTVNCKNYTDCRGKNNGADDNDDRHNVIIIVMSLIAAVMTAALICVCAVKVCRVHLRVRVIQRWLPSKPQETSEHTADEHRSVDMVNQIQGATSATTSTHRTKTSATTLITERGRGDYWEISSLSRSSTHSNDVQVVLLPGPRRRSSSSQREGDKNPYSEMEGNEMNIPGSGRTLRTDDKNPYSELEGNEMNIPGSDGTLGEPQTPELTYPSPIDGQGSGSPTPGTSGHSPTFKLKGSELEDGAECGTTAALVESDYSLASNCDEQPSNSPNKLYNTLDSVGGAYSHLRPIGQQKKIISNIYNG